jgi:hypothetical protein
MFVVALLACFNVMPANAGKYLTLTTEADCHKLTIDGTVCGVFSHHPGILLVYTINVNGQIITGEMWQEVELDQWACLPVSMYIPLDVEMCGDVTISGIIEYYGSYEEFNNNDICEIYEIEEFVTDCPCDEFCPRTPGYWKTHMNVWPVESINLGDATLTKNEAKKILKAPVRGDMEIILKKHMIAAMLNVASGSDPSISDVINEAFECLATGLCDRDKKEELKDKLDEYNNSGDCD